MMHGANILGLIEGVASLIFPPKPPKKTPEKFSVSRIIRLEGEINSLFGKTFFIETLHLEKNNISDFMFFAE